MGAIFPNKKGQPVNDTAATHTLLKPILCMVCPVAQRADTVESLASTLADSQVDLNPHQVEAALSRPPLQKRHRAAGKTV